MEAYKTAEILDILWEHEVRKQVKLDTSRDTATVSSRLKTEVGNAFFEWYKVTSGQWESEGPSSKVHAG